MKGKSKNGQNLPPGEEDKEEFISQLQNEIENLQTNQTTFQDKLSEVITKVEEQINIPISEDSEDSEDQNLDLCDRILRVGSNVRGLHDQISDQIADIFQRGFQDHKFLQETLSNIKEKLGKAPHIPTGDIDTIEKIKDIREIAFEKRSKPEKLRETLRKSLDIHQETEGKIKHYQGRIIDLEQQIHFYIDNRNNHGNNDSIEDNSIYSAIPISSSSSERKFESKSGSEQEKNFFINQEDEQFHQVIKKLGEDATSITLKIIDTRNSRIMCKKILKSKETTFRKVQDIFKEFELLHLTNHPCICKSFGINLQEPFLSDEEENTTISIFIEFLEYSLKNCIEKKFLSNTLKVKIAIEIAFGMAHIHKLGMIHRDLKLENIMLNSGLEAKIIGFDLVHFDDDISLTKDAGTFDYMSPEMQNEDEYTNKTDVYSYGVLLYVIFTGQLPKLKRTDKLNKILPMFPNPSYSISDVCINLIKKCMSFEPNDRPSFDEIIEYITINNFALANEVDPEIINRRYQALQNFNKKH